MKKILKHAKCVLMRAGAGLKNGCLHVAHLLQSNKPLAAFLGVVLIFNALITTSVAWFVVSRNTTASNMGIALNIDDTTAIYNVFRFHLGDKKGTNKTEDGEELNITNIVLNPYDTIFSMQNKYTPVFAQIQITIRESMPESGTVYLTIERAIPKESTGDGESTDMVSSDIIRFTALIDSSKEDASITDPDALYSHINKETLFKAVSGYEGNARSDSKTFVTVTGEGDNHVHTKADAITVAVPYTRNDWDEKTRILNVYLYMTYDTQLIQCFMKERMNNEISLDETIHSFENDFKKISVSYDK